MYATKVRISTETRARLDNPVLSQKKKTQLRQDLIIEKIRKTKSGACTKQELIAAAGYNPDGKSASYGNGLAFLTRMVKHGIISHDNTSKYRKFWVVNADVKTRRIKRAYNRKPVVTPTPEQVADRVMPKAVVVALQDYEQVDKMKLVDMAKEFAWQNNSDSLREFIAYVENAIK